MTDEKPGPRVRAAQAVGQLGAHAIAALQTALVSLLEDEDDWMRTSAAQAVGQLGAHASLDLQLGLLPLLVDKSVPVRRVAEETISQLGAVSSELRTALLHLAQAGGADIICLLAKIPATFPYFLPARVCRAYPRSDSCL